MAESENIGGASTEKVKEAINSGKLVVGEFVNEISLLQDGKGKGTFIRSITAACRLKLDEAKFSIKEMRKSVRDLKDEVTLAPNKFVSETALLQSNFILKSCRYQPVATASIATLLVTFPVARKFCDSS